MNTHPPYMATPEHQCVCAAIQKANEQFGTEFCRLSDYDFWEMVRRAERDHSKIEETVRWIQLMLQAAECELGETIIRYEELKSKPDRRYHVEHYLPILRALHKCCWKSNLRFARVDPANAISKLAAVAVLFENKHLETVPVGIQLALQSTENLNKPEDERT